MKPPASPPFPSPPFSPPAPALREGGAMLHRSLNLVRFAPASRLLPMSPPGIPLHLFPAPPRQLSASRALGTFNSYKACGGGAGRPRARCVLGRGGALAARSRFCGAFSDSGCHGSGGHGDGDNATTVGKRALLWPIAGSCTNHYMRNPRRSLSGGGNDAKDAKDAKAAKGKGRKLWETDKERDQINVREVSASCICILYMHMYIVYVYPLLI